MFKRKTDKILRLANATVLIAVFVSMANAGLSAQSVSSTDLINNAKEYDGKVTTYSGEVIGDIMIRGQHTWININDGQNAIGIWAANDLIKDIVYKGSYAFKGDNLEITGIFHRSCPEHGGDLDIHAQSIRKISAGRRISESLNFNKIKRALLLSGILILLLLLFYIPKKPSL